MALWECAECTAKYSVGAPKCPQCGSVIRVNETTQPPEEEQDMAKVTVHGGPSIEGFHVDPETSEVTPLDDETEGGEDVSAGSSSSTSSETESSTPETSEQPSPSPARTTASRSKKVATDKAGTAPSTDGGQAAGTSASDKQGS
ncbi:hypothetical protein ACFYRN_28900 [Streptomyces sp. NPDC005227]|uniref:hypothetical protein n=1 Tax=Streptomyces sp. NPDC005227 TaxID=3364707 RepID=UPI00369877DF